MNHEFVCAHLYDESTVELSMKPALAVNCYLDMEQNAGNFSRLRGALADTFSKIEGVNHEEMKALTAKTIRANYSGFVMSGTEALFTKLSNHDRFAALIELIPQLKIPVLGICGGHQLIAMAYGSRIHELSSKISGFAEVRLLERSQIFEGLPDRIIVTQSHREHVFPVPDGFVKLADSTETRIEAMAHFTRPIFGTQFHPERYSDEHPDGRMILENFGKICESQR